MSGQYQILVFDLDDTLIDTTGLLVMPALKKCYEHFQELGLAVDWPVFLKEHSEFMMSHPRKDFFDFIAKKYDLPSGESAKEIFYTCEIEDPISLIPGTEDLLETLSRKYRLHLVTMGDEQKQKSKVEMLKIESFFSKTWYVDYRKETNKESAFRKILCFEQAPPQRILSIGNRLDHEIADANRLGCESCWVRHGEHAAHTPANKEEEPTYTIRKIDELIDTCNL